MVRRAEAKIIVARSILEASGFIHPALQELCASLTKACELGLVFNELGFIQHLNSPENRGSRVVTQSLCSPWCTSRAHPHLLLHVSSPHLPSHSLALRLPQSTGWELPSPCGDLCTSV